MLTLDPYSQQELLYCIEGLGKQIDIEDEDGNVLNVYEKGKDAFGLYIEKSNVIIIIIITF